MNPIYEQQRMAAKEAWARRASLAALVAAIEDCRECIALNVAPERYRDEISVYRMEIQRRNGRGRRRRRPLDIDLNPTFNGRAR